MGDEDKTKETLIQELEAVRRRVAELEVADVQRRRAEEALRRNLEERLATEEALRQSNRHLALLNRASQTFTSILELDRVLVTVLEEVRRLLNVVACSVWLIDPETGELVCRQVTDPQSEVVRGWRLAPGEGLAGWVAHTGDSLMVADIYEDERHFSGVDRETGLPLRSILTVPLQVKQRVIGVLQAVDAKVGRFTETDQMLLESLAASAAVAIENAQLYDEVQQYAVDLEVRVAERTRELEEANAQLQELDRLKSKFVADVSHELRTPVANIDLYLHLLERGGPERLDRYLGVLKDQTQRLAGLVEDILDLSRLGLGEAVTPFEPVDLNKVVEEAVEIYRPRAEAADLALTFEREDPLPKVWGSRNQLSQVATNLVANAVNYTPCGFVKVRTLWDASQETVCLQVQDTGMGIEAEDMPHLFERFYRGRRVGSSNIPGSGLGLAIVREILDLHGGTIEVESEVGEGSTFTLRFEPSIDGVEGPAGASTG
jgi:signal transduction histidine kinase